MTIKKWMNEHKDIVVAAGIVVGTMLVCSGSYALGTVTTKVKINEALDKAYATGLLKAFNKETGEEVTKMGIGYHYF